MYKDNLISVTTHINCHPICPFNLGILGDTGCVRTCRHGGFIDNGPGYSKGPGKGLDDVIHTVICRHPMNPRSSGYEPDTVLDISNVF